MKEIKYFLALIGIVLLITGGMAVAGTFIYPEDGGLGINTGDHGALIYYSSTTDTYKLITTSTAGYVLTLSGNIPTWQVATGGTGGGSNWNVLNASLRPTSTIGIIVNASSTFTGNLTVGGTLGGQIKMEAGSAASPSLTFVDDPDDGLYRIGTSNLGFAIAGTLRMQLGYGGLIMANTIISDIGNIGTDFNTSGGLTLAAPLIVSSGVSTFKGLIDQSSSSTFIGYITAAGFTGKASSTAQIGTLTNTKWCTTDGSIITCTQNAPSGGGGGGWTTSTNLIYPTNNEVVLIGGTATTTIGNKLEVIGNSLFGGYITASGFTGNASTADALKANPTDCTNQFANAIAANGNLTCASVADAYMDYTSITLSDFTNNADYFKWANASSSYLALTAWYSTTTADIGESGNLYYTDTRVKAVINATTSLAIDITGNAATASNASNLENTDLGTLTDTKICVYDLAGTEIDCNYTDLNTTYTAGDHLTLTGTDFDVDEDFPLNAFASSTFWTTSSATYWIGTKSISDLSDVDAMTEVTGDLLYYGNTGWTRLASSTDGYVLTLDANGYPSWAAPAAGGGGSNWQFYNTTTLRPTSTINVIMGNTSSTFIGDLNIGGNATTTGNQVVGSDGAAQPGCIGIKDADGTGWTYGIANNGAVTWSATDCSGQSTSTILIGR